MGQAALHDNQLEQRIKGSQLKISMPKNIIESQIPVSNPQIDLSKDPVVQEVNNALN